MQSLLGQFFNRIKGSQEDIASEGLTYILKQSIESRQVINQIIKNETGLLFPDLLYQTQTIGKQKERPDISGIDKKGRECLIIEAKFWAALTKNQPNEYLKRLENNSLLIFLVPTLRTRIVFGEVKNKIQEVFDNVECDSNNLLIQFDGEKKYVIIKSWSEILNAIKLKLEQINNNQLLSDLNQIIGLCDTIDENAFLPIMDSDLSPGIAKKINSYYEIVDKVVDELKTRNSEISTKGLVKTPQRYGYHRYFQTSKLGMNFSLKLDLWEKCADTPFWFSISEIVDGYWNSTDELKQNIDRLCAKYSYISIPHANNSGFFLNLKPRLYETEDVVIKDLSDQIELIIKEITTANNVAHNIEKLNAKIYE